MDTQEMERKLATVRPILVRYASRKWNNLRSMTAEDLAQETLIYAFQHYDKWKDLEYYDSHLCRSMDFIAHNFLLKEHKNGLWLEQTLQKKGERRDKFNLLEVINQPVDFLSDPWLDDFKERKKQSNKRSYERHKEDVKARSKAYYQEHKEEVKSYQKQYAQQHREKAREYATQRNREVKQFQKDLSEKYGVRILIVDAQYLYGARHDKEKYAARLNEIVEKYKQKGKEIKV